MLIDSDISQVSSNETTDNVSSGFYAATVRSSDLPSNDSLVIEEKLITKIWLFFNKTYVDWQL